MIRSWKRSIGGHSAGFTLIELLIVVAIVTVLLAILLPVLAMARENANRAVCAAHLHNNGAALTNYALDNNSHFPEFVGPSDWLWDMPNPTRDALLKAGMMRDSFYCPSGWLQNQDALYHFAGDPGFPYCVSGYYWLMPRLLSSLPPSGLPALFPPKAYVEKIDTPDPSNIEIVTDATISDPANDNFTNVFGGDANTGLFSLRTNHLRLKDPTKAAGGNILFIDGHVVWRDFSEMHIWYVPPEGGNNQWF